MGGCGGRGGRLRPETSQSGAGLGRISARGGAWPSGKAVAELCVALSQRQQLARRAGQARSIERRKANRSISTHVHEDAERRTLAPTQKSSATPGYGGSGGHSGQARGPGGGREAWGALPPLASAPQPWPYCARSGGRAPHNSCRSARREELVRANGSIIFGETPDLRFFRHAPQAC